MSRALPNARTLPLALTAAVGLGVAGRVAAHAGAGLPHGQALSALGHAAVALGAPWLATAWAVGALSGSRTRGALAGGLALALGTAGWYLLTVAVVGPAAAAYAVPVAAAWGSVALAAGAAFGLAGAAWREGGRLAEAVAVAALAAPLAGEAALLGAQWTGRAAQAVLAAEVIAAFALLFAARRRAPLLLTAALFALGALVFAGAEDAIRDGARLAGWGGQ